MDKAHLALQCLSFLLTVLRFFDERCAPVAVGRSVDKCAAAAGSFVVDVERESSEEDPVPKGGPAARPLPVLSSPATCTPARATGMGLQVICGGFKILSVSWMWRGFTNASQKTHVD